MKKVSPEVALGSWCSLVISCLAICLFIIFVNVGDHTPNNSRPGSCHSDTSFHYGSCWVEGRGFVADPALSPNGAPGWYRK